MDYLAQAYKPILVLLILLFLYLFVIRPLLKSLKPAPAPVPPEAEIPAVTPPIKEEEEEVLPREIALGIIRSQPERAAALVKKWLLEETIEERKKALAEAK